MVIENGYTGNVDYHDKFQKLNLSDDFLFGKVMQDEEILKLLLEKVLGFAIIRVVLVQPQRVIEIDPDAHGIRLDVYADDEEGSRYSVEMQQENEYNIPKRSRYYLSMMDLDLLEKGVPYKELKHSFVIFLCLFDPFKRKRQKYTFERRCLEEDDLFFGDETSVVVLTDADESGGDEDIRKFFRYIVSSTAATAKSLNNDFVNRIHERVIEVKNNKDLEVEFMKLQERDRKNYNAGVLDGIEKGEEIGSLSMQKQIIKSMLKDKVSDDDICRYANCTQEFVDEVRREGGPES